MLERSATTTDTLLPLSPPSTYNATRHLNDGQWFRLVSPLFLHAGLIYFSTYVLTECISWWLVLGGVRPLGKRDIVRFQNDGLGKGMTRAPAGLLRAGEERGKRRRPTRATISLSDQYCTAAGCEWGLQGLFFY